MRAAACDKRRDFLMMRVSSFHPPTVIRSSQQKAAPDRPPESPQDGVVLTTTGFGVATLGAVVLAPALAGAAYGGARLGAAGALLGFVGAGFASYAMNSAAESQYAKDGTGTLFLEPASTGGQHTPPGVHGLR